MSISSGHWLVEEVTNLSPPATSMKLLDCPIVLVICTVYAMIIWETRLSNMHALATEMMRPKAPQPKNHTLVMQELDLFTQHLSLEFEAEGDRQVRQCQGSITQQFSQELVSTSGETAKLQAVANRMSALLAQCEVALAEDCAAQANLTAKLDQEITRLQAVSTKVQTQTQTEYFDSIQDYLVAYKQVKSCIGGSECESGLSLMQRLKATQLVAEAYRTQTIHETNTYVDYFLERMHKYELFVGNMRNTISWLIDNIPEAVNYTGFGINFPSAPTYPPSDQILSSAYGELFAKVDDAEASLQYSIDVVNNAPPIVQLQMDAAVVYTELTDELPASMPQVPEVSLPQGMQLPDGASMPDFEFMASLNALWASCGTALTLLMNMDKVYRILYICHIFWGAFVRFFLKSHPFDVRQVLQGGLSNTALARQLKMAISAVLNDDGLVLVCGAVVTIVVFMAIYSPIWDAFEAGCVIPASSEGTAEIKNVAVGLFAKTVERMNAANARNVQLLQASANGLCTNGSLQSYAGFTAVDSLWTANRNKFEMATKCGTNDTAITLEICPIEGLDQAQSWTVGAYTSNFKFSCAELMSQCQYDPAPIEFRQVSTRVVAELCLQEAMFHHSVRVMFLSCVLIVGFTLAGALLAEGMNLATLQIRQGSTQATLVRCDTKSGYPQMLTAEQWVAFKRQRNWENGGCGGGFILVAGTLAVGIYLAAMDFTQVFVQLLSVHG
ncbi:hypothetical protein BASA81_008827 [Batrachochytrium salamandrivorans]|nr:hypothetical protein BASA81_008827 [Batrachochytrium salamandrivorans]